MRFSIHRSSGRENRFHQVQRRKASLGARGSACSAPSPSNRSPSTTRLKVFLVSFAGRGVFGRDWLSVVVFLFFLFLSFGFEQRTESCSCWAPARLGGARVCCGKGLTQPTHLTMRTLRRLKFMSSPSLSDLGKRETAAAAWDERGSQQQQAFSNATWNSIHNGVIAVFQRKGLADHELYSLNEGVRQLLKTELGPFFSEYLQNQLLTKGMVILRDKIRFYEGQKLLDTLAETWDFFFSDVLPMLQAIFYPVQGKEPSVRQLALLHFRNIITLNIKLEDALSRSRARVPPSVVQMLLILQGVHESKGVTEDYLKLETLLQKVVSPYLGTYGLYSSDGIITHSSCILEKRFFRRSKSGDILAKNPVVRSKSYNNPLLTPVAEYETEGTAPNGSSIRRHSVSEMTSCTEMQGYSNLTTITDSGSKSSVLPGKTSQPGEFERLPAGSGLCVPEQTKGLFYPMGNQNRAFELTRDTELVAVAPTASPENIVDQILESIDSDSDGIFIDFGQSSPGYNGDGSRERSLKDVCSASPPTSFVWMG